MTVSDIVGPRDAHASKNNNEPLVCSSPYISASVHFHIRKDDDDDNDAMVHGVCQIMMFVDGGGGGLERPKIR